MFDSCKDNGYYHEMLYPEWGQRMKIDSILYEEKTPYQHRVIFQNSWLGNVLALDGVIQTTDEDAQIYAEMMVHVPAVAHENVKKS